MVGRALRLAAMAFLGIVWLALPAWAQNLDAGKPPGQIFSNTCNACHKSARGLLRTVSPGSLPGFLRQHYTTSSDMAKTLSAYVLANGATDTRVANVPVNRQGRPDAQPGNPQGNSQGAPNQPAADAPKPPRPAQQQAARPDADGLTPPSEPKPRVTQQAARPPAAAPAPDNAKPAGRNVKRGAEPPTPEAQAAALAAREQAAARPANTEAAIVAAIPLPESADLPPPSIGDFTLPAPAPAAASPSDAGPTAVASVPPPSVPSPSPPPTPQSRSSSASLQAGGPPAPPISH